MEKKTEADMEEILDNLFDTFQSSNLGKQVSSDEEAREQTKQARIIMYGETIKKLEARGYDPQKKETQDIALEIANDYAWLKLMRIAYSLED